MWLLALLHAPFTLSAPRVTYGQQVFKNKRENLCLESSAKKHNKNMGGVQSDQRQTGTGPAIGASLEENHQKTLPALMLQGEKPKTGLRDIGRVGRREKMDEVPQQ